jgi:hypothetical protein
MTYYKKLQELGSTKNINNLHVVELPANTILYRASADGEENTDEWFGINWFGINFQDVQEYGRIIKTYRVKQTIRIILLDDTHNVNQLAMYLENTPTTNYNISKLLKEGWGRVDENNEWDRHTIRMEDYITISAIGAIVNTRVYDGTGSGASNVGQKHHPEIALFDTSKLEVIKTMKKSITEADVSRKDADRRKAAIRKRRKERQRARKTNQDSINRRLF